MHTITYQNGLNQSQVASVNLSQNAITGPKLDDCLSYGFWQLTFFFYANPDK